MTNPCSNCVNNHYCSVDTASSCNLIKEYAMKSKPKVRRVTKSADKVYTAKVENPCNSCINCCYCSIGTASTCKALIKFYNDTHLRQLKKVKTIRSKVFSKKS